ncbi:MAG: hypothetical protein NT046_09080 [Arenimonas sp.]|nr:hypothetical protein [Arenimonas sp.]
MTLRSSLGGLAVAIIAVTCTSGCIIERRNLQGWDRISPSLACPGDVVSVGYDFLGTETCRNEEQCAGLHPSVVISSSGDAFPARTVTGYRQSFDFTPVADETRIAFDIDRGSVRVPTTRVDAEGRPIDVVIEGVEDIARTVTLVRGNRETELVHDGMCAGGMPVNSPETLPGDDRTSPNLRLVSLCNRNGVSVVVTLNGSEPGVTYTQALSPGQCLDPNAPGVPSGIAGARTVEVRPMFPAGGTVCSATGPSNPPPTLRTVAVMACR